MAKGSRGGKRAAQTASQYVAQNGFNPFNVLMGVANGTIVDDDDNQPVQQATQPAQTMSATYNSFLSMTDDEKADVISTVTSQGVPVHLQDNALQRFIYNLGLNDKPDLVDDATLDKMSGKTIYRTVDAVFDKKNDISYNADQIAKQLQGGRYTRVSGQFSSVYGSGLYFADSKSSSAVYGSTRGNVKKTAMVRAKLNSNAKIISDSAARNGVRQEIRNGTKLGKALSNCDSVSQMSVYALSKGYNVIDAGNGYFNILNRQACTMSKTISAI